MKNDPAWFADAACKNMDTNMFFVAPSQNKEQYALARRTCASCRVATECADYAMYWYDRNQPGLYGGMNTVERDMVTSGEKSYWWSSSKQYKGRHARA